MVGCFDGGRDEDILGISWGRLMKFVLAVGGVQVEGKIRRLKFDGAAGWIVSTVDFLTVLCKLLLLLGNSTMNNLLLTWLVWIGGNMGIGFFYGWLV